MAPSAEPPPIYEDARAHLRDELWRVWLRVEYQIRRFWELGTLPSVDRNPGAGASESEHLVGVFRAVHAEYLEGAHAADGAESRARPLYDNFVRQSQLVEARVAATLAAGVPLPLLHIARSFDLTRHQREILTFALMPEVDPNLLRAYRYLSHDASSRGLDARLLALLVYDTPERRADLARDLSPLSPLLYYRLLEQEESSGPNESLLYRRLRPAARLVQMLTGKLDELDPLLYDVAELVRGTGHGFFAAEARRRAEAALGGGEVMLVIQGPRGAGKRTLLAGAARAHGRHLLVIHGRQLAGRSAEAARPLVRSLLREARLLSAVPVIPDVDDLASQDGELGSLPELVSTLCAEHRGPIALTLNRERTPRIHQRPVIHIPLALPTVAERTALWSVEEPSLSGEDAVALAERYAVAGGTIVMAARAARASRLPGEPPPDVAALDLALRNQLHDRITRLGIRIDTPYSFDDLVVDDQTWDTLWELVARARVNKGVRAQLGFRGAAGISVLFSGEPGVGKSMSAAVIARELDLALYEIDLSRVVSKWVGETEKNLAEVFEAAEPGHVVLLFNEADALFGKRTSEVKSATDRYANLEINYLLQRLEQFSGVAILTTNLGRAIDPAFRRRFAYDINFPFPSPEMRAELWRRAIPAQARAEAVDHRDLAERFELSGGFIKVAAERSSFLAAALGEPITHEMIRATVERMYHERGKLVPIGQLE